MYKRYVKNQRISSIDLKYLIKCILYKFIDMNIINVKIYLFYKLYCVWHALMHLKGAWDGIKYRMFLVTVIGNIYMQFDIV